MKNLFLLSIMISLIGTVNSQTTKGTWVIGLHNFSPVPLSSDGSLYNLFPQSNALGISFGTRKDKIDGVLQDDKEITTVFGMSLNSHYFVANHFAMGLVGNFSSSRSTYKADVGDEYKSSASIFLLGPEVRYYFDSGAKTEIWLRGGASLGSVSTKYDGESSDPINLSQFGGGAGISIFPVSSVSIDLGLGYTILTASSKNSFLGDYKSINSGLTFDVGFGIFF